MCLYLCVCVCMYVYVCLSVYVIMYVFVSVCTWLYVFVGVSICLCLHIYVSYPPCSPPRTWLVLLLVHSMLPHLEAITIAPFIHALAVKRNLPFEGMVLKSGGCHFFLPSSSLAPLLGGNHSPLVCLVGWTMFPMNPCVCGDLIPQSVPPHHQCRKNIQSNISSIKNG